MPNDKNLQDYLKFLNPKIMKQCFVLSSCFITLHEILKETIIDNLRDFFVLVEDEKHLDEYNNKVLSKDKKGRALNASIIWLLENNVINDNDISIINKIAVHRNEIAHNMMSILADSGKDVNVKLMVLAQQLITKIDRWWIINVEIPTSGEYTFNDVQKMDQNSINSLRSLVTELMVQVALGNDENMTEIYNLFIEKYPSIA